MLAPVTAIPPSCTQTAGYLPFCNTTSMLLSSCTWWFITNIFKVFLWSPFCYCCQCCAAWQKLSTLVLSKPVPIPQSPVLESCCCHWTLLCVAWKASCWCSLHALLLTSLWLLLSDATGWLFPFEFLFLFGPKLAMWQMLHVLCNDGNVPCLHSTCCYFHHHLHVPWFCISPVAIVCTTHCMEKFNIDAAATSWQCSSHQPFWEDCAVAIACCRDITFIDTVPGHCCFQLCIFILMLAAAVAMTVAIGNVAGWCHCHCAVAITIAVAVAHHHHCCHYGHPIAIPSPTPSPPVDCSFNILF